MPQSRKSEKVYERTGDVYKEFQRKLFYLVRTSPRSLDEIAERTGKSRVDCMRWLRRMVDDGLLREMRSETRPKKIIYKIVLNGLN
jgi:DNA-binding Lrp family transcriptional regulator